MQFDKSTRLCIFGIDVCSCIHTMLHVRHTKVIGIPKVLRIVHLSGDGWYWPLQVSSMPKCINSTDKQPKMLNTEVTNQFS